MAPSTLAALGVLALVVLGGVVVAAARRREFQQAIGVLSRETRSRDVGARGTKGASRGAPSAAGTGGPGAIATVPRPYRTTDVSVPSDASTWVEPDAGALGATRRQFLNRGITGFFTVGLTGFGAATLAFLWPKLGGGFGSTIRIGNIDELRREISDNNGFLYKPEGRMWVTEYPANALEKARTVYSPRELAGMEAGVVAIYQKCPHLGCRVPECVTSQWFECPCHGSQYNRVGEKKGGPAPRGMDRFAMSVSNGVLTVDTGTIISGPAIGTNTTGQEAEGPHCVGSPDAEQ